MTGAATQRQLARSIFLQTLAATTVPAAFHRLLHSDSNTLHTSSHSYSFSEHREVVIVALGKAGATMHDAFDILLPPGMQRKAVVVAPFAPRRMHATLQYVAGGHPEPNAASLTAAHACLHLLQNATPSALVIFLISGGASALCELPLTDSITLEDVITLNRLLVGSGASITEINTVRKHLSRIKGGRLALAAGTRQKLTLLVSDVPEGALDSLGSGPSLPDTSTVQDCMSTLTRHGLLERLPAAWQAVIRAGVPETPKPDNIAFANAHTLTLLDNAAALTQAARSAAEHGYRVFIDNTCDDWDYTNAADFLLHRLLTLQQAHSGKLCLLSGGEVTVKLPTSPGTGGRNQQFCLQCVATGIPEGVTILSAGTDGIDGNSPAAGAIVDSATPRPAALDHLAHFNAYPLFAQLGDAILTGPTGNNLRDLRILLSEGH